ncbi:MAG TPA: transcriptional repressor [Acidimicrobiales bacterium]|nr:transcriptional repressor [Acidimicrobiales bacterium]
MARSLPDELATEVARRLGAVDQRFTAGRRELVGVLEGADRPLTVPEILAAASAALPQSSAYRNLTVLLDAGVVRRLLGTDELARFELAEDLAGHHHHLLCSTCGAVSDVSAAPKLERALSDAARLAAEEADFEVTEHRIDLVGVCSSCR